MKIIPPLDLTAVLTSSTATEPGSGETAWASGGTYALGVVRIRTATHRKYECIVAVSGSTTPPEDDATHWADAGPTNKFAMLDAEQNTATTLASPLTVVIEPGQRVNALALFGVTADQAVVTVNDGASDIYTNTIDLVSRITRTWSEYFFGAFQYRSSIAVLDIPPVSAPEITVALTRASGDVECQTLVVGNAVDIGSTEMGAESDILDFSRVTRDEFGSATLVRRKNVPTMRINVLADKISLNKIRRLREELAGQPAVFLGLDDSADDYYDATAMLGFFKRFPVVIQYPEHALCTIEVEGL